MPAIRVAVIRTLTLRVPAGTAKVAERRSRSVVDARSAIVTGPSVVAGAMPKLDEFSGVAETVAASSWLA